MEKFIYTNPAGKSITFDYSGDYLIETYDGLTSAELEPITIKGYSQNGYKLGNMLFGARYITIYFDMIGKTAEDIYMKRAALGSILNPILGEGILTYTNDSVSRSIRCIPSVLPTIQERMGLLVKMSIEFACYNPFWFDTAESAIKMEGFVGGLTYPLKLDGNTKFGTIGTRRTIVNNGDIPAPIRAEFINATSKPRLTNSDTNEYIQIDTDIQDNEKLLINTEDGNKTVFKETATGITSAFNYININSSFFKLRQGENHISFSSTSGTPEVILYWRNYYVGV